MMDTKKEPNAGEGFLVAVREIAALEQCDTANNTPSNRKSLPPLSRPRSRPVSRAACQYR